MSKQTLLSFLKDERASVAIEYLMLTGILGLGWAAAGKEYQNQVVQLFDRVSLSLHRIDF
ncbi:hypothetical protein SAMN04515647_4298 [Cohaesibacter sp. ES.047]|uniref:Flp family type IVb pilin n=1 Tax=Cohaesibacter sp. ES.047 TaxID=1798205 RepID=UPI000BB70EBF|nr:hypothetical protein [Cohaesibacter sp. ES.047]SNY93973.1 hypothetical protein SAMN04515647_4298 [Cohaesibacter sp. ES.047]